MTTVVINGISIKEGGSMVVLRELLTGMAALRPAWTFHAVVNSQVRARLPDLQNVAYLDFPAADSSPWRTRLWYETRLPALVKQVEADLLFSLTNYLPWRRLSCRTLLLVQHAGHFSTVFRQLTEASHGVAGRMAWRLKGRWVRSSVRNANMVTVQTASLAKRIAEEAEIESGRVIVIPHGIGQARMQSRPARAPEPGQDFRVGYITKYGVQKNFSVLFAAAARLRATGIPVRLVLTLTSGAPETQGVLQLARETGVIDIIENHGELDSAGVGNLYRSLHAFVFPSLCESFGFPLVEAMAFGTPLLVADVDSNVEVAGDGGRAFPAHDPEALAGELSRLAGDAEWFRRRAQASLARAKDFAWSRAATETVSLMEALASGTSLSAPSDGGR